MFDKNMNEQFKNQFAPVSDDDFGSGPWEQQTSPVLEQEEEVSEEVVEQAPEQEFRQYNNPVDEQDRELAPGLYESDIVSWKRQYPGVYRLTEQGQVFVFRPLNRFEYKSIVALPEADVLMREEVICEYCVLYPQGYSFSDMANDKAGLPSILSEQIMKLSGFTNEITVERL